MYVFNLIHARENAFFLSKFYFFCSAYYFCLFAWYRKIICYNISGLVAWCLFQIDQNVFAGKQTFFRTDGKSHVRQVLDDERVNIDTGVATFIQFGIR